MGEEVGGGVDKIVEGKKEKKMGWKEEGGGKSIKGRG